ncbi:hypothetical protein PSHT_09506 [Puccinia striiformis]|uniref:U3 small nucleolar RNA-associated protein 6 N-terminal domain-containing protein n=1 Tax=Puccinia striiformis TaxID=27350 RepID=A0A2S4VGE8_9BASI|nr:hypothetical protein PSHT_09506 [Puccinia striiformis]
MESAQLRMERMLPELRDLEQKKTFTKPEISAIVTQRNYYEALIARPKKPECYINISRHAKGRTTLSDYSIPLHILSLYSAAAKRFPESLELWASYIAYSLTQASNKLVSRVLSAAIAAHPSHAAFWVMAAQFEADDGNSLPLWIEWIRIELNFIRVMEKRREAFGLLDSQSNSNDPDRSIQPEHIEHVDQALQTTDDLDQLPEEPDTPMTPLDRKIDVTELKGQEALLSGALVRVVLQNACQAIPGLDIFDAILPLLHAFESPLRPTLLHFLYGQISEMYPNSPKALNLVDLLGSTILHLQQLCKDKSDLKSMSEEFLIFLIEMHTILKEVEVRQYVSAVIRKTVSSAIKRKTDTPKLHQLAITHYENSEAINDGLQLAKTATQRFPECLDLWDSRLGLLLKTNEDSPATPDTLLVFQQAIQRFPGSIRLAEQYTQLLKHQHTKHALNDQELWSSIEDQLDITLKTCPLKLDESRQSARYPPLNVAEVYQRALTECPSRRTLPKLTQYLSNKSILSLNFLSWLLDFKSIPRDDEKEDLKSLEDLHELVISHPNAQLDQWINYLSFLLINKKDCHKAGQLLAKAKTSLGRKAFEQLEQKWMLINSSVDDVTAMQVEQ